MTDCDVDVARAGMREGKNLLRSKLRYTGGIYTHHRYRLPRRLAGGGNWGGKLASRGPRLVDSRDGLGNT